MLRVLSISTVQWEITDCHVLQSELELLTLTSSRIRPLRCLTVPVMKLGTGFLGTVLSSVQSSGKGQFL